MRNKVEFDFPTGTTLTLKTPFRNTNGILKWARTADDTLICISEGNHYMLNHTLFSRFSLQDLYQITLPKEHLFDQLYKRML